MSKMRVIIIILILLVGIELNKRINLFLKQWIAEPLDPKVFGNRKRGKYANPSGHAQFYSFILFFVLFFYFYMGYKSPYVLGCIILIFILYINTIVVCMIYGYHTPKQLFFGTVTGFLVCTVYILLIKRTGCVN
jgi:membrane-associated phospholipid phosphatase